MISNHCWRSSIENVEANAEARVHAHLGRFTDSGLEDWIEQGTSFTSDPTEDCPYCGQPLETSNLIAHYQAYFSDEYKKLKSDIREFASTRFQFDPVMDSANKAIVDNIRWSENWRMQDLKGLKDPIVEFEDIRLALTQVLNEANALLSNKANSPLDPTDLSDGFNAAYEAWNQILGQVSEYNRLHDENNDRIRKHKEELEGGKLEDAESELLETENIRIRYSDEVSNLCDKFSQLQTEQQRDNQRKADIQDRIEQEVANTYSLYGEAVNELLQSLNADFRLINLNQRRDGTNRQARYHIGLLGAEIPVGGDLKANGGQSYKNALSEGDRRTLALAFFLARLNRQATLDEKIFVFDDPVTSMDDNRSASTADLILATSEQANQVIILSHRKRFLRNFWKKYQRTPNRYGELRFFEVCPKEGNADFSDIRPNWDIKRATETDFEEDVRYVVNYIRNSPHTDMRNAAPKLRLVLETYYQWLYQDEFDDGSLPFGGFIDKVLGCNNSSELYALKTKDGLVLKRLNESTSTFHHPSSLDLAESELRQLCKDTLDLIGRRY